MIIVDTKAHFIDEDSDFIVSKRLILGVPRLGEEVRFCLHGKEIFYKVIKVVWVYDEPECPFERVNIGLEMVGD